MLVSVDEICKGVQNTNAIDVSSLYLATTMKETINQKIDLLKEVNSIHAVLNL